MADNMANGPAFEVSYGTCDTGWDGGCFSPVNVSTSSWEPSPTASRPTTVVHTTRSSSYPS